MNLFTRSLSICSVCAQNDRVCYVDVIYVEAPLCQISHDFFFSPNSLFLLNPAPAFSRPRGRGTRRSTRRGPRLREGVAPAGPPWPPTQPRDHRPRVCRSRGRGAARRRTRKRTEAGCTRWVVLGGLMKVLLRSYELRENS